MKSTAATSKKQSSSKKKLQLKRPTLLKDLKKAFGLSGDSLVGFKALYNKEMMDQVRSKRFMMILALIIITGYASLYGALSTITSESSDYLYLALFTTSGNSIPSFMTFMALLGPFVGIVLGFDGISGEKSERTLYRIAAQPIYRDSIINGKFLAGMSLIFMLMLAMGGFSVGIGILAWGVPPTTEEIGRILVYLFFMGVYISFWLALSLLFSVVCGNAAASAMASIGIWLFFALFMSMVAEILANAIYPLNTESQIMANTLSNYTLELNLNRISPYYLFSEAAYTIMNPSVRAVNVVTVQSLSGAVSSYLSLGQSMLLVWPHLAGLVALMLITFTASYICFMRQEIRTK